jgi:hypothetical protein
LYLLCPLSCSAEVDVGLAADIGTLQRGPKHLANASLFAELALTGRDFDASEALRLGFLSRVVAGGRTEVLGEALAMAATIASKSPVAVVGSVRSSVTLGNPRTERTGPSTSSTPRGTSRSPTASPLPPPGTPLPCRPRCAVPSRSCCRHRRRGAQDMGTAVAAVMGKTRPTFSKL